MTMYCLTGLLPNKGTKLSGKIVCGDSTDILNLSPKQRRGFCSKQFSIILQDSINALDPYQRIDAQWAETIRFYHPDMDKDRIHNKICDTMSEFGIRDAKENMHKYPHQLSGGMRQRIAIALALESDAKILIADEPTTSLDSVNQRLIIDFIDQLCRDRDLSLIYITHNLGIVSHLCDRAIVLRNGNKIEDGTVRDVFLQPQTDYARKLINETARLQEDMQWEH